MSGGEVEVYVSAATSWELAIKAQKGRLSLPASPERYVLERVAYYRFQALPVQIIHACRTFDLPAHHTDPFDRLLVAQCLVEGMTLVSADERLRAYDVEVIW